MQPILLSQKMKWHLKMSENPPSPDLNTLGKFDHILPMIQDQTRLAIISVKFNGSYKLRGNILRKFKVSQYPEFNILCLSFAEAHKMISC